MVASSNPHKHKLQKLQDKLRLVERDRDAEVKAHQERLHAFKRDLRRLDQQIEDEEFAMSKWQQEQGSSYDSRDWTSDTEDDSRSYTDHYDDAEPELDAPGFQVQAEVSDVVLPPGFEGGQLVQPPSSIDARQASKNAPPGFSRPLTNGRLDGSERGVSADGAARRAPAEGRGIADFHPQQLQKLLANSRAAARGGADPQQARPRLNGSPDKKASAPPGEWSTPSPDNGAGRPARGPMPIYTPLGSHMHTQSSGLSAGNTSVHNGPVPVHAGLLAPPEYSGEHEQLRVPPGGPPQPERLSAFARLAGPVTGSPQQPHDPPDRSNGYAHAPGSGQLSPSLASRLRGMRSDELQHQQQQHQNELAPPGFADPPAAQFAQPPASSLPTSIPVPGSFEPRTDRAASRWDHGGFEALTSGPARGPGDHEPRGYGQHPGNFELRAHQPGDGQQRWESRGANQGQNDSHWVPPGRAAAARQEEPRREQQEPQERWRDQWGDDKKPWEKGPDDSALGKQASIDQLFPPEPKQAPAQLTSDQEFPSLALRLGSASGKPAGAWGSGRTTHMQITTESIGHAEREEVNAGLRLPGDALTDLQRRQQVRAKKDYTFKQSDGRRRDGRLCNVAEGLELHHELLNKEEQSILVQHVHSWVDMGRRGLLKDRTFSQPRKSMRGKGRVTVQFGCCYNYAVDSQGRAPGIIAEEVVDPMPPILDALVRRLVRWGVVPALIAPDSAIVNIYDVDDCIPPHIDHHDFVRPFVTISLLNTEEIMFGQKLVPRGPGDFYGVGERDPATGRSREDGHFLIPLPPGSCLVLKGNGADVAMHCVPPVRAKRMSITLRRMGPVHAEKVRKEIEREKDRLGDDGIREAGTGSRLNVLADAMTFARR